MYHFFRSHGDQNVCLCELYTTLIADYYMHFLFAFVFLDLAHQLKYHLYCWRLRFFFIL